MVKKVKNTKKEKPIKKIQEKESDVSEMEINDLVENDIIPETNEDELENSNETQTENKKSRIRQTNKDIEALKASEKNTAVLYIGHLPWGFDESGVKKYFEQFGKILRVFVPKSTKTGRMKGYGFVEFEERGVAEIAQKTMNNYVLFEKVLQCEIINDQSRYNNIFKKYKKKFEFVDKYKDFVSKQNKTKSKEEIKQYVQLLLDKEEKKRQKLKEMGIEYNFPGYKAYVSLKKEKNEISQKKEKTDKKEKIEKKEKTEKKELNNSNKKSNTPNKKKNNK